MTTPAKPVEEIIPLFNVEMKNMVPDYLGKFGWAIIGGPYERPEADQKIDWLEKTHPHREYRITKAEG